MAGPGALEASYFSDKAKKDLLQLLQSVPGKKNLVIQRSVVGPIETLVKVSTLQEYGVDRIFFLENDNVDSSQRNVVFLARAEKPTPAQAIAGKCLKTEKLPNVAVWSLNSIKRLQNGPGDHEFTVLWVPRRTRFCEEILEEAGVLGDITSMEFPLYLQALEDDLLSMELEDSFSELFLRKDPTCIFAAAKALTLIQQRHGLFPRIIGKGDNAHRLAELIMRMRNEQAQVDSFSTDNVPTIATTPSSSIEHLIIIDREVDFSSVLLTQLTYEGLIDEVFGINHGQTELDSAMVGFQNQPSQDASTKNGQHSSALKRKIKLDSNDKLYDQLRNANFAIVGGLLNKVARRLQTDYEGRHGNKTTAELRDFVSKLPGYQLEQQSLKIHTVLAEEVMKQTRVEMFRNMLEVQQNLIAGADPGTLHELIEDLIAQDFTLPNALRLLCLESCISGGLRTKDFDSFRRQILQAYGYKHLLTLDALDKMQLLQQRSLGAAFALPGASAIGTTSSGPAKTNYSAVRKSLQLIVDDVNEQDPDDIAYVYSGYAPLSVRLVQAIIQKSQLASLTRSNVATAVNDTASGWRGFEDSLKNIKGRTFDETQSGPDKAAKARQSLTGRGEKKTSVIFFLGGISFAEIAALRLVVKQEEDKRRIVIVTTSILSGSKMMQAAIDTSNVERQAS